MSTVAAPPVQDSVIELDNSAGRKQPFYMARVWLIWLQDALIGRLQQAVAIVTSASVPNATDGGDAAILPTTLLTVATSGRYRVSYVLRITQAATTSSSAILTLTWGRGGQSLTFVGADLNGNTLTSVQSDVVPMRIDALTDLTYEVAYSSVGATPMEFELDLTVEQT